MSEPTRYCGVNYVALACRGADETVALHAEAPQMALKSRVPA